MASDSDPSFRDKLVAEVADSFHAYIGEGISIPGPSALNVADTPPMPSLNIDGLDEVLRVHFVISGNDQKQFDKSNPRVMPFMRTLADRVRRLDVDIQSTKRISRGGIDGPIDWQATTELYQKQGYIDQPAYVTRRDEDELLIKENRVLRELLQTLQGIFVDELSDALTQPAEYDWLREWLQADDSEPLKSTLDRVLNQNPVMRALDQREQQHPGEMGKVSMRDIRSVKRTRKPIYRQAAYLLERYRQIVDSREFSEEEAREVLRDTYIRPDSEKGSDLFELYWIFYLIENFDDAKLTPVRDGDDVIAEWSDAGPTYELIRTSRMKGPLDFAVALSAVEDEFAIEGGDSEGFLPRQFAAESDAASYAETAFDITPTSNIWSGIPDILLYKFDGESELEKILIGEVKYSADTNYLKEGIRELLEYVYLCTNQNGDYLMEGPFQNDSIDERIEPVLFTRQLPEEISDDALPISIVEYGSSYTPFEEA